MHVQDAELRYKKCVWMFSDNVTWIAPSVGTDYLRCCSVTGGLWDICGTHEKNVVLKFVVMSQGSAIHIVCLLRSG